MGAARVIIGLLAGLLVAGGCSKETPQETPPVRLTPLQVAPQEAPGEPEEAVHNIVIPVESPQDESQGSEEELDAGPDSEPATGSGASEAQEGLRSAVVEGGIAGEDGTAPPTAGLEEQEPGEGTQPSTEEGTQPDPEAITATADVVESPDVAAPIEEAPVDGDVVAATGADATPGPVAEEAPGTSRNPPGVDPVQSNKVFEEARELIGAGKLSVAAELMEKWLATEPRDVINRKNLIHIYVTTGKYEEALPHLKVLTLSYPREAELWAHLGRVQAQLGYHSDAVESLRTSLELDNRDSSVALDLARELSQVGKYVEAAGVLDKASVPGEINEELTRERANILVLSGEYNKAYSEYRKLQQVNPTYENAILMARLAARFDRCRDVVDALAGFQEQFTGSDPFLLMGECLLKEQNLPEAEALFTRSIELTPTCFDCQLRLGDALFSQEKWLKAAEAYEAAARLNPTDARSYHQMGKSLANGGEHYRAVQAFAAANERAPKDAQILFEWGLEAMQAGERGLAWKIAGELDGVDKELSVRLQSMLRK